MVLVALALIGVAFSESKETVDPGAAAGGYLSYGAPIELGKGKARAYVVRNQKTGHPVEVGVALTEGALEGLAQQASAFPAAAELPAGYVSSHLLMNLPPEKAAVPRMGLHWLDRNSSELPPRNRPFTATFIIGSWGGKVLFDDPMVTRDFLLAHRDSISGGTSIPVPAAGRYVPAGFYMDSYRVSFDRASGEYRVAPTGLAWRE